MRILCNTRGPMMNKMRIYGFLICLITGLFSLCLAKSVPAATGDFIFDKSTSYDIYYYGGGDSLSFIKDVEILRVDVIHDSDFLVVQGSGFKVKNYEGYILFSSIRSILPHNFYRVQRNVDYSNQ